MSRCVICYQRKGTDPKVKGPPQFVKRQAAIKNDPGFAGVSTMPTTEVKTNRTKPIKINRALTPKATRQTSSYATDIKNKNPGRRKRANDGRSGNPPKLPSCFCCSGSHELASCPDFQSTDLQNRWDIMKHNGLCHLCLRSGHYRGKSESPKFCRCGSDKRHHKLFHNPPRSRRGCDR